jgi:hypothetical protein
MGWITFYTDSSTSSSEEGAPEDAPDLARTVDGPGA